MDVGAALIGDPELLFLDEPTTGFDPSARRQAWEVIGSLRRLGKTVFLTTHYMEEAQALADRVAIIRRGEIVAEGPPSELGGRGEAATLVEFDLPAGAADLPQAVAAARVDGSGATGRVNLSTHDPVTVLNSLTGWALERGVALGDLEVHRPSLEDVYLELTGEDEEEGS